MVMKFQEWITGKYIKWRGDAIGHERSISDFAKYIGASQQVVSGWMNGSTPNRQQTIAKLATKYPDVYEALGLPTPEVTPPEVARIVRRMDEDQIGKLVDYGNKLLGEQ